MRFINYLGKMDTKNAAIRMNNRISARKYRAKMQSKKTDLFKIRDALLSRNLLMRQQIADIEQEINLRKNLVQEAIRESLVRENLVQESLRERLVQESLRGYRSLFNSLECLSAPDELVDASL